uniref:Ig-like domain-containing protein n=1 Tax=Cyprinus carpio TaxID=7962 RepID=A0A8C2F1X5_CYPCA
MPSPMIQGMSKFWLKTLKVLLSILIVLSPSMEAPKIIERIQSQTVCLGDEVHFRCRVTGKPDPECQWFKNGVLLEKSDRVYWEGNEHTLLLIEVFPEDAAQYNCEAKNDYGVATSSASLNCRVSGEGE